MTNDTTKDRLTTALERRYKIQREGGMATVYSPTTSSTSAR